MDGQVADYIFALLTIFYGVILMRRGWRMGFLGMWKPIPCPPPNAELAREKVNCCQHNPCPDRPRATKEFRQRPWRCLQCGSWWITEPKKDYWQGICGWEWKKVSEQVGDKWITDLK